MGILLSPKPLPFQENKQKSMKSPTLLKTVFNAIEFTNLTGLLFLVHALGCVITFAILGASPYINATSVGLAVLMDIAFFLSLRRSTEKVAAHLLIFSWYVLLFFNIRIAALLVFPPEALEFPAGVRGGYLANEEISAGLVFVVAGVVAVLSGISYAGRFGDQRHKESDFTRKNFSLWALTAYWVLTYVVAYYVIVHLGVSVFKSPENWGSRMAWVRIIFDTDVALMYTVLWVFVQQKCFQFTKTEKLHVGLLVFLWLAFSVLIGSRGGPFRILLFTFIAALAVMPKFKLSIAGLGALVAAFFVINSYVFAIGTAFRHSQIENVSVLESIENYHARRADFKNFLPTEKQTDISSLRRAFYDSDLVRVGALRLRPTITRLAIIDYPLTIVTRTPNEAVIDYYIRSLHPIKNFINSMVPGEIFQEAIVNTSRVFGMAYIGKSLKDISENYMSEPFTLWGEGWLIAGYLGLPLLFGVALFTQAGLNFAQKKSSMDMISLRFVYIMTVILGVYGMFGIDYWLTSVAHFSIASFIASMFIRFFPLRKRRG
jgi:hypothetical protein